MNIRRSSGEDHEVLLAIWLASVRWTHHFLSVPQIRTLQPMVRNYLERPGHVLWVLCDGTLPIGFMGLDGSTVQSLFVLPERMRRGGGRALLAHARTLTSGPLIVDVNEQNVDAMAFYRASGFSIVGRSENDDQGRPYPIVHMRQSSASTIVVHSR